ncbi:MAG: hypothetical protein ACRD6W_11695 [Nitrososphaerales archaeon]
MKGRTAASFAATILVVALLSGYLGSYLGPTRNVTIAQTTSGNLSVAENQVYKVTFQQVQYCGEYNILPWGVTIDGLTQIQPHNQTLPLPTNTLSTIVPDQNLTEMSFYLAPGTYNYTLLGGSGFEELTVGSGYHSGSLAVSGSDVVVDVGVSLSITCTSTKAA